MGEADRERARYRDFIADRGFAADPIYMADMDVCQPAQAISPQPQRRRWHTVSYETSDFAGTMLCAGPETVAPEVTYPLNVTGWHAVSIGIHPTNANESEIADFLVRLSHDSTFSILKWPLPPGHRTLGEHPTGGRRTDYHFRRTQLHEIYWKTVDLTRQQLVIRQLAIRVVPGDQPGAFKCGPVRVAYIKLVPLSEAEVDTLQADRADPDRRRLYCFNDMDGNLQDYRPTSAEAIRRQLEPFRESDFVRVYWQVGRGDVMAYPTKIARTQGDLSMADYPRVYGRLLAESWNILREKGIDQVQVGLEYAHQIGLEFHACYRAGAWRYPIGYGPTHGGFYEDHPELRCVDRQRVPGPRISYAFRETQDFVISLLREFVGRYAVDGVCIMFNRRPPYLMYESPLIESFEAEYGEDPHELDERDPRWIAHRAAAMTSFMRRVREAMDVAADEAERQKRLGITAFVLGVEADNLFFGLDVAAWAREGLVDTLIPYSPAPLALPTEEDTWSSAAQVEPFVAATRGTSCRLAVNVMPYHMHPEDYRRMAAMLYGAGAASLFFWASSSAANIHSPLVGRANYWPAWNALRRLGHRGEIEAWIHAGEPSLEAPSMALTSLGGFDMSYVAAG